MVTVAFGESTMSRTQVQLWYNRFKEGREDVRPPLNLLRVLWITLGSLGNVAVVLTFFLGASPVYHWCGFPGTSQFWETAGRANSPRLLQSFRNPLRLNWMCHMPRSSWPLRENSFGTPTYPGSMRSPAPPLDSPAPVG